MIKNIVVNLSVGEAADAASAYAVSVAAAFEAHLAGIAFSYEPSMAEFGYEGVAVSLIESERAKAARFLLRRGFPETVVFAILDEAC